MLSGHSTKYTNKNKSLHKRALTSTGQQRRHIPVRKAEDLSNKEPSEIGGETASNADNLSREAKRIL